MALSITNGSHRVNESDEVLVGRSQRGDRAAFEELVRRTARLVFSRLYLETGSSDRAEDLAQETFLLAWRKIRQVTDPAGFRSWLFTIAQSVAIDAYRRDRSASVPAREKQPNDCNRWPMVRPPRTNRPSAKNRASKCWRCFDRSLRNIACRSRFDTSPARITRRSVGNWG